MNKAGGKEGSTAGACGSSPPRGPTCSAGNDDKSLERRETSPSVVEGTCDFLLSQTAHEDECSFQDTQTLVLIEEMKRVFETRLQDIEEEANGDVNLKMITYKEWAELLLRVLQYLLATFHEIEDEATKRLALLERKLQVECRISHGGDICNIKNDLANLLELIRRAVKDRKWCTDGLEFKTLTEKDIFGESNDTTALKGCVTENDIKKLNSQIICQTQQIKHLESEKNALKTELNIKDLQLQKYIEGNKCIAKYGNQAQTTEDKIFKDCVSELKQVLEEKDAQLASTIKENEFLKSELNLVKGQLVQKDKLITNMKALTVEVADKHDQIQQMRNQLFSLEDEVKNAEKKIQFKDNVIKELRRDCKNASAKVCSCLQRNPSPTAARSRSPSSVSDSFQLNCKERKDSFQFSCKEEKNSCQMNCKEAKDKSAQSSSPTCTSATSQMSDITAITSDTVVYLETRLHSTQREEAEHIKKLQEELDQLFICQNRRDQTLEDQTRRVSCQQEKLKETMNQLFADLNKNRKKLAYIRNQLVIMSSPCDMDMASEDSGYTSQEEMEPESSIIQSVKSIIQNLKNENNQLKSEVQRLQCEIQGARSSASNFGSFLKEIASALSNMRQTEVQFDENSSVQPVRKALMGVGDDLFEKNKQIDQLLEKQTRLEKELQCLYSKNSELLNETQAKDRTILELQQAYAFQSKTIGALKRVKGQQECQLEAFKEGDNKSSASIDDLLNEKNRLDIECKNQLTTISNLRKALESHKRGNNNNNNSGGNSLSTASTSAGGNNNNSLWNWWRSGVHDV